eukprot:12512981-Alexandrium_andersonii.AAC.1
MKSFWVWPGFMRASQGHDALARQRSDPPRSVRVQRPKTASGTSGPDSHQPLRTACGFSARPRSN